jgi:hypothetical protein
LEFTLNRPADSTSGQMTPTGRGSGSICHPRRL